MTRRHWKKRLIELVCEYAEAAGIVQLNEDEASSLNKKCKKGLRKDVRILVDVRVDVKPVIRHSLKTKNLGYT